MANKDFKVKNGIDVQTPIPVSMGGTGQTSTTNTLNSLLPAQSGNANKILSTDGTNTTWVTLPNGYQKGNTASRPGSPSLGDIYSNTETGYIEVYTAAGWSQLGVIPTSATIGTATDVGTNITYGSGAADVSFTPGSGGGLVTSFTAVSNPGAISASGSSSPIRVSGLSQGTAYTFTVTATNGYGNALASSSSNSITATSLPQAPTIGTASNPSNSAYGSTAPASLTFTVGATGGKSITNYKYSTDGVNYVAFSPAQTSSPLTIGGLNVGQPYTFRIKAVNANGDSTESSASNSVTLSTVPQAPTIGTATNLNESQKVSVSFTAPANNGGSSITSYTVTSSPGGLTASGASSPITVTGLTNGTAYTFTVKANNANGSSLASAASNSATPTSPYPIYTEMTSSTTYTPSSFPATVDVYLIGGGGSSGNTASTSSGNRFCIGWGGGGGGGYRATATGVTINSALTVTVGNAATGRGGTGGTTSVSGGYSLSASGGNGGTGGGVSSINTGANTGTGGNGGSGGGAGSAVNADDANGSLWQIWYGGSGGTNGGNGGNVSMSTSNVGGSAGSQGIGSGVQYSPGGGGGGNFQNTTGASPGILVGGSYRLASRGTGGSESNQQTAGGVLVVRNA
jgi:hypothetical protein